MIITQANLDALRLSYATGFEKAYEATETWYQKLATDVPSTTRTTRYGWLAQSVNLREWVGARVAVNLSEHEYSITNKKFEGTIEVDRDHIEDDNLGMYQTMLIPELAQAAKQHPDQLIAEALQANPTAFDGKALFANDHPCFDEAASTYDNLDALALTADNFHTVYEKMVSFKGENGRPLKVAPKTLFVPPQLRKAALTVVDAVLVGGGDSNVLKGWVDVVVIPELANEATTWYLADTSKALKPFLYQLRRAPEFISRDNLQDPKVFDQDKFTYGVSKRCAVGVTLPFLIAKSVG